MHELAIAQKLIESATALLLPDATSVTRMRIHLGTHAGLSEEELRFGFEVVSRDTACEKATLEVEIVPAVIHCPQCGRDFSLGADDALLCPTCASPSVTMIQGKELIIASMDVAQAESEVEPQQVAQ